MRTEFTGERLAISDFNVANDAMKPDEAHGIQHATGAFWAAEQRDVAHIFDHPDYGRPTADATQIPLR